MHIAERVDEVPNPEIAHLRDHVSEKRVGGDVEGHAEKDIRAALVELATQASVAHIELEKCVTRRQGHAAFPHIVLRTDALVGKERGIPRGNDQPPGVRRSFDLLYHTADLVDRGTIRTCPASPLPAVDRTQIPILRRPLIPDTHTILLQGGDVCGALQKPQEFVDDGTCVELLCGKQREPLAQIHSQLPPKHAERPRACAVFLTFAVLVHIPEEIEVLFHEVKRGERRHIVEQ